MKCTANTPYYAYLCQIDGDVEIEIGNYSKLSAALVNVRCACREKGRSAWDWVVDKRAADGTLINRRSSIAGLEK